MYRIIAPLLAMTVLLAGCSSEPEKAPPVKAAELTLFEFMTKKIDPDADVIWTIGNKAIDAKASIDPKLLTDKDWETLESAGLRMASDARALSAVGTLKVKPDGVSIADEGTPGAPTTQQIEGHIARDHDLFRSLADTLGNHAEQIAAAAAKKDHVTTARLINELDGVCESCHLEFWYPEQKALIQNMGIPLK
jgi:hypothetical protein